MRIGDFPPSGALFVLPGPLSRCADVAAAEGGYSFPNELGPIISADIEINRTSLREIPHTVPCHGEAMSWQGRIRVKEPKVGRLRYPTEEHRPVVVLAGSEHL